MNKTVTHYAPCGAITYLITTDNILKDVIVKKNGDIIYKQDINEPYENFAQLDELTRLTIMIVHQQK